MIPDRITSLQTSDFRARNFLKSVAKRKCQTCFILEGEEGNVMAKRNTGESVKVQQVLKLVHELTPEERDEVLYRLKLDDLRREIQKGIDSADRGELYSEDEVMAYLDEHHKQRLEKQTK